MTDLSLRELGADDLLLARELFESWRRGDNVTEPPATDEMLAELLRRADFHVVAALREGALIGGLTAYELTMYTHDATELFVYEVGVLEAYRRQGVGRALVEWARQLCQARGFSALYIPAMADDARAVAFYAACGLKREDVAWFSQEWSENGV